MKTSGSGVIAEDSDAVAVVKGVEDLEDLVLSNHKLNFQSEKSKRNVS